jgi:hypothetical protein
VQDIIGLLTGLRNKRRATVRQVQSVIGKLNFAAQVLPGACPFTRKLIDLIRGVRKNNFFITIDAAARADAAWWCAYIGTWNGRMKWRSQDGPIVAHDASLEGFGFVMEYSAGRTFPAALAVGYGVSGRWSECHAAKVRSSGDIQWAELFAIVYSLHCYGPHLRDSSITVITDNIADVAIINRQSTKCSGLLVLLRALYMVATANNIQLTAQHRSGVDNVTPDILSRISLHKFKPSNVPACSHVTFVRSGDLVFLEAKNPSQTLSRFLPRWL